MYYYRLYGFVIQTDIEFRQLIGCEETSAEIFVTAGEIPGEITNRTDVKYEFGRKISWLVNNTCWLLVQNGNKITYMIKEGGRLEYLKSYILGWGMSMLALQRGVLAMHCSAVGDEQGAFLICGESGAGKSTLTTELLEGGLRLMADDMALIENRNGEVVASPAFPYQKLCRDVALTKGYRLEEMIYIDEEKDKFLVPYKGEFSVEPLPVRGILMLGKTKGSVVMDGEITGINRFQLIANNLFLRHLLGQKKYEPEIGQLCLGVAARVPAAYLIRPLNGDSRSELLQRTMDYIKKWKIPEREH